MAQNLTRRAFLQLTVIGSTVPILLNSTANAEVEGDVLKIQSSESRLAPATHHSHALEIPLAVIENPPAEGISLRTEWALSHKHRVVLTQADLKSIAAGNAIVVEDTIGDHLFEISTEDIYCHKIGESGDSQSFKHGMGIALCSPERLREKRTPP